MAEAIKEGNFDHFSKLNAIAEVRHFACRQYSIRVYQYIFQVVTRKGKGGLSAQSFLYANVCKWIGRHL
jgi:hypothetical protein